ncbi:TauD/TfdA family dioxygenase [Pseudocolwellia sp. AS88]|uniref:TauD/TfdA family dioxygenase n=1 Tax=Pseudocolwellia sp. AS88 TaxID=3063958 RepID=UPI0026E9F8E8|nr:TauD/TfdA family dioxygenase [Pseudocolwellia sp. AS88]MDO7084937.1 TauD/TfdA family dioxygenase [Pseudocolwellia sp. AS88]
MAYISNMLDDLRNSAEEFPAIIVNDGSIKTIEEATSWISSNLLTLQTELNCTGAILFRGFPVTNAQTYDDFFSAFGYPNFTYKESLSNAVRINYTEYVFTANEAPKDVEIYLHNEMAQTPIYPERISLFCEEAADHGGATVICRSDEIYKQLVEFDPETTNKLEQVGIKYTTIMPGEDRPESGQGRSWRSTLSVSDVARAEEKLKELGYTWQWLEDGSLKAQTAALPAIRTLQGDRKVFFNQIIAAYKGWQGVNEDPSVALCFGDNTFFTKSYLDKVVSISESVSYNIDWQNGDVALVDNNLAMHGRRPYSGETKRKVLVVLGQK